MTFTDPGVWAVDAADISREESRREKSPASFFFSQGQALVLAANYFTDARLRSGARGGVAKKHRHRIQLALFGQLMAALEYLLKDFIAKVVDLVPTFDHQLLKADWLKADAARILSMRSASTTAGSLLLHPTLGWQQPEDVNRRYKALFGAEPIDPREIPVLEKMWLFRHSVAHNAGFVSAYDATRAGVPALADRVAGIDGAYVTDSFDFLCKIARRVAEGVGDQVLMRWLVTRKNAGPDYLRDKPTYGPLKLLATYTPSRAKDLPSITKGRYTEDFKRLK